VVYLPLETLTQDIPTEIASENFFQIGIIGNSTALSSFGLRKALTSVERGGYQFILTILEAYASKWKKYIALPADFYRERKFLKAGKRVPKPARQGPRVKARTDKGNESKQEVFQKTFLCLTVAIGSTSARFRRTG
jgi:hypothetical protein